MRNCCDFESIEESPGRWRHHCRACGVERSSGTPQYLRYCDRQDSRGLGDTIAKAARTLGIRPCGGCKRRQQQLNRWFPYNRTGS